MNTRQKVIPFLSVLVILSLLTACAPKATEAPATQVAVVEATATQPPVEQPTTVVEPTATAAPAPTQAPAEKKVATFIWTQEFDTLNPYYTNMWFSTATHQWWNSWAWEYDEKNEAHPKLVTEIPSLENGGISADGKTITMKLLDGLKWSDNEPLTAKDFVFTYEMVTNPKNTVASTYPYDLMEGVKALDDKTVEIKFKEPFAPWKATLWKGLLPEHILKPVFDKDGTLDNAEWNRKPTVGCGPYVFAEWESGSFARFVRNDNYWGQKPKIDEIFVRFVPDDAAQVAALLAGDGDLGTFIAYSDVPKLKAGGITVQAEPSGYNEGLFFLINYDLQKGEVVLKDKGNPALRDVKVRQAIAYALDRASVNKDLLLGLTTVPASFWDSLPNFNNPPVENYAYDPEKAKALLDEAGWKDTDGDSIREKDGVKLVLKYGTTIREIRQSVQAVFQQQLAAVGIKVELASYESDLYFSGFGQGPAASGDVDIQEWSDAPAFPDADIYYWKCSEIPNADVPAGTNSFFLCDKELDDLIAQQAQQVNPVERQQTIAKINQIFHDKVYWLGLWQDPDVWAVGPRLGTVKFSGVTPFFDIVNWDLK